MDVAEVFVDGFGRVAESVHGVVDGLSADELAARVEEEANPIIWLVWHLTRVEDDHVAHVDPRDTGYGHRSREVAAVRTEAPLLLGYFDAVHEMVQGFVSSLSADDLDRVVDTRWDPPVTLGVRLVSVVGDVHAHLGQAEFVRGILLRRRSHPRGA
jgi:hypothetical protein